MSEHNARFGKEGSVLEEKEMEKDIWRQKMLTLKKTIYSSSEIAPQVRDSRERDIGQQIPTIMM